MVDFTSIILKKIVIHKVGNRLRNEGTFISKKLFNIENEDVKELLLKYFLSSFTFQTSYRFSHGVDLNLNEIFTYTNSIFKDIDSFYDQSINVLNHLYQKSTHPKIKEGEFYMVYLENCYYNGFYMDGIGVFKSENKDLFLKVNQNNNSEFEVNYEKGINVNKLDKGCIVLNTGSNNGFTVFTVDAASKNNNEAQYWKEEFLNIKTIQDDTFQTETYLKICADFSEKMMGINDEFEKKDKLIFINNAIDYFSEQTEFNVEKFEEKVFKEPAYVQSFNEYKRTYEEQHDIVPLSNFSISGITVNKAKRNLKNLIKLDTNIQIKISNTDDLNFIEKGYDEKKGMNFYKVYFNNEI